MGYAVEMINITKRFAEVVANNHVTLRVPEGEIYTLVGENGAGKSTLMGVLYGLHQPDSGEIRMRCKPVRISDPRVAIGLGIGLVHQHFMLVPSLTVAENVVLGRVPTKGIFSDLKKAETEIAETGRRYGLEVDPSAKLMHLSVGEMQRVEIVKALHRGVDILILDEPTAVLTPQEITALFRIMTSLVEQGKTIIFITHKLNEVMAISDRVAVMRDGKMIGEVSTEETSEGELARMMVGRDVVFRVERSPIKVGVERLRVEGVSAMSDRRLLALRQLSFSVRSGQILGIAGVEGNGQAELAEVLTGLRPSTGGRVYYKGREITNSSPRERREMAIAHIPADRLRRGVSLSCTIEENLILGVHNRPPLAASIFINAKRAGLYAQDLIKRFGLVTTNRHLPVSSLSGGNMQRMVLARELGTEPDLLIAVQPTRGVDLGASEYIHKQLFALRDRGCAVLLISANLEEIMSLSDRIAVMYEGEIIGELDAEMATEDYLGLLMTGVRHSAGSS
jgi:ABC-type uncharacterized transport system ATPase subunit